ncbi:hypothetical protein BJ138DRAFT_1186932 [Hygrophoropsis aurantiaca]|uniref:Uncharacterized protein n=1 Tax=Hygrophoropsis aurantiaca TaxID=72124 RepID=A0ACB7ZTN4_9AGAM|nr:hypothetical protein BJ138DRAFT_1186932 [Hygrophoropsis aurantiaca]
MRFIDLPADPLLAIFLNLDVEDISSLKQSCRVLYAVGSLDYLWHRLVRTCNLPLDIPLGADSATLSGQELQAIVVNALKLDHNWRKPDAYIQRAILIIPDANASPVDSMYLLPGGKWLITTQLIRSCDYSRHVDLTLWCLGDITGPRSIKTVPIYATATSCRAYYHSVQHEITIAVALQEGDSEWIEVYHISLDDPAAVTHSETLEFQPVGEFSSVFNIHNLRIYEDVLGATYYHQIVDEDYIEHPGPSIVRSSPSSGVTFLGRLHQSLPPSSISMTMVRLQFEDLDVNVDWEQTAVHYSRGLVQLCGSASRIAPSHNHSTPPIHTTNFIHPALSSGAVASNFHPVMYPLEIPYQQSHPRPPEPLNQHSNYRASSSDAPHPLSHSPLHFTSDSHLANYGSEPSSSNSRRTHYNSAPSSSNLHYVHYNLHGPSHPAHHDSYHLRLNP